MGARVLMIEDDQHLAALVAEYLGAMGMRLTTRTTAADGLKAVRQGGFEAVILDVMLPDLDGFEVCRRARTESDVPILMLTARGEEMDRILGLGPGADDCLPKSFNPRELLARLRAILRRRIPRLCAGRGPALRAARTRP
jgi:DNA-binding response OmpR family regulator